MKLAKEFNTPGSQAMEAAVASRNNILLMGDHLGDINMSEGTDSAANILSIGFLNELSNCFLNIFLGFFFLISFFFLENLRPTILHTHVC